MTWDTFLLAASLAGVSSPLQVREKLYLLGVGYYRSGDYSRSRHLAERCLEVWSLYSGSLIHHLIGDFQYLFLIYDILVCWVGMQYLFASVVYYLFGMCFDLGLMEVKEKVTIISEKKISGSQFFFSHENEQEMNNCLSIIFFPTYKKWLKYFYFHVIWQIEDPNVSISIKFVKYYNHCTAARCN